MHTRFPSGHYYGTHAFHRAIPGIKLSHLQGTVPEHEVMEHAHEGAHIILATRGHYITSAAGQEREGPTLIFNPADIVHRDRFQGDGGWFFAVSFDPESSLDLSGQLKLPGHATRNASPVASKRALQLLQAAATPDQGKLDLDVLTINLLECFADRVAACPHPPRWLKDAQDMIADLADADLGIEEIAGAIGVHRVYLARQYQRHFGCTPGEDLRRRRVERATQLLLNSKKPLSEIATNCGYCDQSHLNRAFLNMWGVTPTDFLKLHGFKNPRSG